MNLFCNPQSICFNMEIKYKKLAVWKRFPRYSLINISEDKFDELKHEFNEIFRQYTIENPPSYNLLKHVVYDTKQGPFDLYDPGVIGFNGALIVSNKLLRILNEYNLQEHIVFPGIQYTFKGEKRDNMNFLVFYKNYEQYVDYTKSTYRKVKPDYFSNRDENGNFLEELILQDDIKYKSKEHYLFARRRKPHSKDPIVILKHIFCSKCIENDVFLFNSEDRGLYISPRLVDRLKKEKIKGIDYWGGTYFDFTG